MSGNNSGNRQKLIPSGRGTSVRGTNSSNKAKGKNDDLRKKTRQFNRTKKENTPQNGVDPSLYEQAPSVRFSRNTMFSPKMTKFQNLMLDDLPDKARKAAETLGMEKTWNNKGWHKVDEYSWEDLSALERDAAYNLGWDQAAWNNHYEDSDWNDLPSNVITAASFLGFNQCTWDGNQWPAIEDKDWSEMTEQEQDSLFVLGYNKYDWDE